MFALFDKLCLLSDGHVVYFGAADRAADFFEQAGLGVPPNRNPADHFLHTINRDFLESEVRVRGARACGAGLGARLACLPPATRHLPPVTHHVLPCGTGAGCGVQHPAPGGAVQGQQDQRARQGPRQGAGGWEGGARGSLEAQSVLRGWTCLDRVALLGAWASSNPGAHPEEPPCPRRHAPL